VAVEGFVLALVNVFLPSAEPPMAASQFDRAAKKPGSNYARRLKKSAWALAIIIYQSVPPFSSRDEFVYSFPLVDEPQPTPARLLQRAGERVFGLLTVSVRRRSVTLSISPAEYGSGRTDR
jgi:hypothetical protein